MGIVKTLFKYWPLALLIFVLVTALADLLGSALPVSGGRGVVAVVPALMLAILVPVFWSVMGRSVRGILFTFLILGTLLVVSAQFSTEPEDWSVWGGGWCLGMLICLVQLWQLREESSSELIARPRIATSDFPLADSLEMMQESSHDEPLEDQGEVSQSWTRLRLENGGERVQGTFVLEFSETEQIKHFHLPVSPPFVYRPVGWCEVDQDGYRVSFTQLQTYGTRLTIRRQAGKNESETVELCVVLTSINEERAAA